MESLLDGGDNTAEIGVVSGEEEADQPVQKTVPSLISEILQETDRS